MDFRRLFEAAWTTMLANIGPLILITLVYGVVMILSLGLLAPVTTAGYMQSLLLLLRKNRRPEIRDLFSEMSLLIPLTVVFFMAIIVMAIGFMLLVVPGFVIMAFLAFSAIYFVPLMTDRRLGTIAALQESWSMATREPVVDHVVVVVLYLVITSLGSSIAFGFLVTQPFATLLVLRAYIMRTTDDKDAAQPADISSPSG